MMNFPSSIGKANKVLPLAKSFALEMKEFESIMTANPLKGKEIFQYGVELNQYSSNGNFFKFMSLINNLIQLQQNNVTQESSKADSTVFYFPFLYFLSKSLESSLVGNHFMISTLIIDYGYPLNHHELPNPLIAIIRDSTINDDAKIKETISFLAMKLFDFNQQESKTYFSPLHYAVEKSLPLTVEELLRNGSDVNSVADKDIMPLNLALSNAHTEDGAKILDLLYRRGAKSTWRSNKHVSFSGGFSPVDSTQVSVKGNASSSFSSFGAAPNLKVTMKSFSGGGALDLPAAPLSEPMQAIQKLPNPPENQEVVCTTSEDGCSLFSTG